MQDFLDIGYKKDFSNVIDQHFQRFGRFIIGDEFEDAFQHSQSLGDVFVDKLTVKFTFTAGAGGKDAIGEGLSIEIGKLFQAEVVYQQFFEAVIEIQQHFFTPPFFLCQFIFQDLVPQKTGAPGEGISKGFGVCDSRERKAKISVQQGTKLICMLQGRGFAHVDGIRCPCHDYRGYKFPVLIEPEFIEIGEDKIGEGAQVALQLFAGGDGIKLIDVRSLGFNVAGNVIFAIPNPEVRIARICGFGENGYRYLFFARCLGIGKKHLLQTSIETFFTGITPAQGGLQINEILAKNLFVQN